VKKIAYYSLLALTVPCLGLALVTALGEAGFVMGILRRFPNLPAKLRCQLSWQAPHAFGDDQNCLTRLVARPFLWAVEREDD